MKNSLCILLLAVLIASSPAFAQKTVKVAAAANLQYVLDLLKPEFEKQTGIKLQTTFGASGKLSAQIAEGAPFDVFVSADMTYPEELSAKGFTVGHPKVYAIGILVMWTSKPGFDFGTGLDVLKIPDIHKIAVANPLTAPYGRAAIEAMKYYQVFDYLGNKLVYGENVSQTTHFVETRAAEVGFIAKSLLYLPEMAGKGSWVAVDVSAYAPLNQGLVVLKYGKDNNNTASQQFYNFLFSKTAQDVFSKFGYNLPTPEARDEANKRATKTARRPTK